MLLLAAALLLGGLIYFPYPCLKRAKKRIGTLLKIALGLNQLHWRARNTDKILYSPMEPAGPAPLHWSIQRKHTVPGTCTYTSTYRYRYIHECTTCCTRSARGRTFAL